MLAFYSRGRTLISLAGRGVFNFHKHDTTAAFATHPHPHPHRHPHPTRGPSVRTSACNRKIKNYATLSFDLLPIANWTRNWYDPLPAACCAVTCDPVDLLAGACLFPFEFLIFGISAPRRVVQCNAHACPTPRSQPQPGPLSHCIVFQIFAA